MKLRLQPIRVFCFHHVSDTFDEGTMKRCDWLQTDLFKQLIHQLREEGYTFISLPEAHAKIQHDVIRCKKYVVLTVDDGWASQKNILPWLNEQKIPITMFLNPCYLDGMHYREKDTELYLTEDDVMRMHQDYPFVTIGSHGWEHKDATKQTVEEFIESLDRSEAYLKQLPNYIPFFAFTYGRYTKAQLDVIKSRNIIPLFVKGNMNYTREEYMDREVLGIDYLRPYM